MFHSLVIIVENHLQLGRGYDLFPIHGHYDNNRRIDNYRVPDDDLRKRGSRLDDDYRYYEDNHLYDYTHRQDDNHHCGEDRRRDHDRGRDDHRQ